jgi:MYXO-CTERM domain-containing protein
MNRFLAVLIFAGCVQQPPLGEHTQRIVGGILDPNHRYVVAVGGNRGAFCSGTVISSHTVLTAGHCIGGVTKVYFGSTVGSITSIDVVQQIRNPMYMDICNNDATYDHGILKLAQPAPTQAAPLLRATLDNTSKYVGPSWSWVGYGNTSGNGGGFGTRRVVTFPIALVGPAGAMGSLCMIPETLIYASVAGRNACNGDSGGPSFWIGGGVEQLAGVTSSGDDPCMLDDTQQRTDQPYIDQFIQANIDAFENMDPCRSDGMCNESCNMNGQLGDPDCAANHCGADGICAEACVAPRDPDCYAADSDNCGDNGVCDLRCPSDPDCVRMCGADGNCIPNCPTPDPDCSAGTGGSGGGSGGSGGGSGGAGGNGGGSGGAGGGSGGSGGGSGGASGNGATTTPDSGCSVAGHGDAPVWLLVFALIAFRRRETAR